MKSHLDPLEEFPHHPRPEAKYNFPISSDAVEEIFSDCTDFVSRNIYVGGREDACVTVCFVDGLVDSTAVSEDVIRPLVAAQPLSGDLGTGGCIDMILHGSVYSCTVEERRAMDDLVSDLLDGYAVILFNDVGSAITFETRSGEFRGISPPEVEKSVKGSKDTFIEPLRMNTALVRRKLKTPDLKVLNSIVGRRSETNVAVVFIDGIANQEIVDEVLRRLDSIDIDGALTSGCIEEYIVDRPKSPFPQLMQTERPDIFCKNLLEGRVGIIVDGLPFGYHVPCTLPQIMKSPDDDNTHFLTASPILFLRYTAFLITFALPMLYVAVAMYHQEMIPTKLLLSVIDSKQNVPFSTSLEILGMLLAFELIQEAGLRLPNPVGQSVGIIGGLIVGQSAVEASVISPIAVIIVAMTGIAGYTIPNHDLGTVVRLSRFVSVVFAMLAGIFGVLIFSILFAYHLCTLESYGESYLAPISDNIGGGLLESLFRKPLWLQKFRPAQINPNDKRRQR